MITEYEENYKTGHAKFDPFDIQEDYIQVCSSLPNKEVIKKVLEGKPKAWEPGLYILAEDYYGEPNPSVCEDKPDTHQQFLFVRAK